MIRVMVSNYLATRSHSSQEKDLRAWSKLVLGVWYVALMLVTEETIQATQREDGDATLAEQSCRLS